MTFTSARFQSTSRSKHASMFLGAPLFRKFIVIVLSAIITLVASPAIALDSKLESDVAPRAILNLDMCTLAYQLYHQSLCLPLDPWYDVMSRIGSDRRNNICRLTHEYAAFLGRPSTGGDAFKQGFYSGPNSARGWAGTNTNLDPILTNYKQIDARLPAFTRDGEVFMALHAPNYVTNSIKSLDVMRYSKQPTSFPCNDVERIQVREYPSGDDHLIAFEGGTGMVGNTTPSWSLMGFVLLRKTSTGYDAYIVFRGSRSGSSLSKTVWKAQGFIGENKGNPDWITDLRGGAQIEQPLISRVGTVTQGFAEALPSMLGTIAGGCKYLQDKYPAPEHIYVTGHSLGAGLASQFVSAVKQGTYGNEIRNEVPNWPWDKTLLTAYAQPIPGDPTWAANFDKVSPASEHYWVGGDDVVEATSGTLVGLLIDKGEHSGRQNKLNKPDSCNDNPHEVFVIRAALLRDLGADSILSKQLGAENTWGYYDSFSQMMAGQQKSYLYPGAPACKIVTEANLQKMLQNYNFGPEFDRWLEQVYAGMIVDKSSYIGPHFQSTLDERRQLVLKIANMMRTAPSNDATQELNNLGNDFSLLDGNLGLENEEQWIYTAMILDRIQKSNLSLQELMSNPEINKCLESTAN